MKSLFPFILLTIMVFALPACVSKKKFTALQSDLDLANKQLGENGEKISQYANELTSCQQERDRLKTDMATNENTLQLREEQISELRQQIDDLRKQRDASLTTVQDLTTLSKSANDNIRETLSQLERKDEYIQILQAAKTRADSINLALAVNLKGALADGIADNDVDVKVDKTVVFVNLSDKMLYQSGSARLTSKASDVLGKIAQIVEGRQDLEIMVEGYTDNVPIKNGCIEDNWDLSVKRATSVVRVLQDQYNINPDNLIAAGRGEYNTLASNDTAEGRSTNRRTRIIILPKLDQFYDLLNPNSVPN